MFTHAGGRPSFCSSIRFLILDRTGKVHVRYRYIAPFLFFVTDLIDNRILYFFLVRSSLKSDMRCSFIVCDWLSQHSFFFVSII